MDISYTTGGTDITQFHVITTGEDAQYLNKSNTELKSGSDTGNLNKTTPQNYLTPDLSYNTLDRNDNVLLFIGNTAGSNAYIFDVSGNNLNGYTQQT